MIWNRGNNRPTATNSTRRFAVTVCSVRGKAVKAKSNDKVSSIKMSPQVLASLQRSQNDVCMELPSLEPVQVLVAGVLSLTVLAAPAHAQIFPCQICLQRCGSNDFCRVYPPGQDPTDPDLTCICQLPPASASADAP